MPLGRRHRRRSRHACARSAARLRRRVRRRARAGGPRPERGVPRDARAARSGGCAEDVGDRRLRQHRGALRRAGSLPSTGSSSSARPTRPERAAERLVAEHGGRAYATLDELLADDAVELVVNLTVAAGARRGHGGGARGRQARAQREAAGAARTTRRASSSSSRRGTGVRSELRAGDAARRGAAVGVEARPRRRDRAGARRLRRGELGPHRALASRTRRRSTRSGRWSTSASTRSRS